MIIAQVKRDISETGGICCRIYIGCRIGLQEKYDFDSLPKTKLLSFCADHPLRVGVCNVIYLTLAHTDYGRAHECQGRRLRKGEGGIFTALVNVLQVPFTSR